MLKYKLSNKLAFFFLSFPIIVFCRNRTVYALLHKGKNLNKHALQTHSRLLIYCHSRGWIKQQPSNDGRITFSADRIPRDAHYWKVVRAKFGHRNVTKVTNRATYLAISLYLRWITLLLRVFPLAISLSIFGPS